MKNPWPDSSRNDSRLTHYRRGARRWGRRAPGRDAGVVEPRHLKRVGGGVGDPHLERGGVARDRQRVRCAAGAGEDSDGFGPYT